MTRPWQALSDGIITNPKARIFVESLTNLSPELAAKVVEKTLPDAGDCTPGQLRKKIQRAVITVDPQAAEERHEQAKQERRVQGAPADDSMAWMRAYLTADELASIMSTLNAYAHSCPPDDPRSMDTRRADALLDLITGGSLGDIPTPPEDSNTDPQDSPDHTSGELNGDNASEIVDGEPGSDTDSAERGQRAAIDIGAGADGCGYAPSTAKAPTSGCSCQRHGRKPGVDLRVVVKAGTLLGLDNQPAFLAGYGAIPASMARRLAKDSTWRRLLTDPSSNKLTDAGRARYRPSTALQEYIEARDVTCRWPGCRRAAQRCDKDHSIPFPDGSTCETNLVCLCRYHHRLKTHSGWKVRLDPDGTYTVMTPTGRIYLTEPPQPGHDTGPPTRNRPRGSIYLNDKDDPDTRPFKKSNPPPPPPPAEPPF
ncbi:hypothetical protein GCM10009765_45950 [Fodinicola feengrottensis]|uniref:HNH nuclease domain-containing protein n=1 Tax=Fodinicola feengrottensis TaxID=435914 RepID=A0ABP4TPX6_9ACTN